MNQKSLHKIFLKDSILNVAHHLYFLAQLLRGNPMKSADNHVSINTTLIRDLLRSSRLLRKKSCHCTDI